ncbi:Unknown protein [Striga hermonthica]|uniref:Uncharacterized protein n=1 Tax=Striga hermonthica TaxID=68872 RepID=A0A9N7RL09_STRHE|nr:Unknown protein [Striga hermonthica]
MITRSKLVEQLRDYQIRSQHRCPALVVFSPKPVLSTWTDVAVAIFWALSFILLLSSSYVILYLKHYWISLAVMCIGILVPIRLRVARQSLARKRDRRLLLPLSIIENLLSNTLVGYENENYFDQRLKVVSGGQQNEIPTDIFLQQHIPLQFVEVTVGGVTMMTMSDETMDDVIFGSSAAATKFVEELDGQFSGMPTAKHLLLIPQLLSDLRKRLVDALAADNFQHMYMTNDYGVVCYFLRASLVSVRMAKSSSVMEWSRISSSNSCLKFFGLMFMGRIMLLGFVTEVLVHVAAKSFRAIHCCSSTRTEMTVNSYISFLFLLLDGCCMFFILKLRHCLVFLFQLRL